VACAAVELLCEADLTRLGMCPPDQHGCGWVFIDRSRNGSRRWCTMDDCGAHAKARRLTERRRTSRATTVSDNDRIS
jgi:predicted RNA-binding Zn ribbon-like protein